MEDAHILAMIVAPVAALGANVAGARVSTDGADDVVARARHVHIFISAGALMLAVARASSSAGAWSALVLLSALGFLAVFDARRLAVPVAAVLALIVAGLGIAALAGVDQLWLRAGAALAGWAGFRWLDLGYRALRGRSGLGAGDALVAAVLGAWLSFEGLAWSVALGASVLVVWALLRGQPPSQPLAFVPGLAIGAALVLILEPNLGVGP